MAKLIGFYYLCARQIFIIMGNVKKKESKEHKKPWREVYATVEDIQNFLMDRILLRHNVITGRVEYRLPERDYFQSLTPPCPSPTMGGECLRIMVAQPFPSHVGEGVGSVTGNPSATVSSIRFGPNCRLRRWCGCRTCIG